VEEKEKEGNKPSNNLPLKTGCFQQKKKLVFQVAKINKKRAPLYYRKYSWLIGMQKHSKLLLLSVALPLFAAQTAQAEENITELKIEDITTEVEAGAELKFSFSAGNRIGLPCPAEIRYWVGSENLRVSEGQHSIFLGEGETKADVSSLLIPEEEMGIKGFYLQMKCNEATVLASKPIKVSVPIPIILEFSTLKILEATQEEPVSFSYTVKSNSEEPLPIYIEEQVIKDGNEVWSNTHHSFISGSGSFDRQGPVLPAGNYTFVAHGMYIEERAYKTVRLGEERPFDSLEQISLGIATIERDFVVVNALNIIPLVPTALLGLLAVGATFTAGYLVRKRRGSGQRKTIARGPPTEPPTASAIRQSPDKEKVVQAKNYVCLIESESGGTPDKKALNTMLEEAGFAEEERKFVFEVADKVPVEQRVKSSVFIDRFDKPKCETSVTMTISNNTSKDWCDVVVLAKIPGFLSENVSEIKADESLQVMKEGQIAKFTVPKIAAMQSTSLVYSIEKWIPQDKVNLVPLPAVINYEEAQPLVVKLRDSKKAAESKKIPGSVQIAEKQGRVRKKKSVKKAGKKA
jgi:hypothetical protein